MHTFLLPEINTFIRNYSNKNVIVVAPVESLNTKVKSIKDYHSYFVDIHHPSSLGHILIAEKIMEGVFLEFPSHRKYKVDECGNIEFFKGNQVVFIKTSPDRCANSKNENIVWLKKFMAAQPISYPYNMFKLRAEASLNQVGKNSRLLNNSEF